MLFPLLMIVQEKTWLFSQVNQVTTDVVIELIDKLIKIYGKPRQILTDNGGAYGLKSKIQDLIES